MFDRYAAATAPSWGRRALVIASVVLHGSAALGLGVYSLLHVEEIAPPAVSLTFFSAPPPPPPPPPPARKKSSSVQKVEQNVTKVVTPTTQTKIVQPQVEEKKDDKKDQKDDGEEGGVEGGVKGGVQGGTQGGVVGGVVGGTGTDVNAKAGPAGKAVPFFTLDCTKPNPHLPESFTSAHAQQTIKSTYKVSFDLSGNVTEVAAMVAVPGADETIREQIKRTWKCKSKNGQQQFLPTAIFPINFVIN